jgi:hypothetical protein
MRVAEERFQRLTSPISKVESIVWASRDERGVGTGVEIVALK